MYVSTKRVVFCTMDFYICLCMCTVCSLMSSLSVSVIKIVTAGEICCQDMLSRYVVKIIIFVNTVILNDVSMMHQGSRLRTATLASMYVLNVKQLRA